MKPRIFIGDDDKTRVITPMLADKEGPHLLITAEPGLILPYLEAAALRNYLSSFLDSSRRHVKPAAP